MKNNEGEFISKVSDVIDVDEIFILKGKERYNIYCSVYCNIIHDIGILINLQIRIYKC